MGLKLLHRFGRVVDERKPSRLAATKLGSETENGNLLLAGLVHCGELGAEVIFGDVGEVRVEDVTRVERSRC